MGRHVRDGRSQILKRGHDLRRYDESDVRLRPGAPNRARTKRRPEHAEAKPAMVVGIARGRQLCALDGEETLVATVRARELGRRGVAVGDRVHLDGDVSGAPDTLARIVRVDDRTSALRRTAEDDGATTTRERVVVANATQLLIVVAAADPPPRVGLVRRALVAAYVEGIVPRLAITKADLADPAEFEAEFNGLKLDILRCGQEDDLAELEGLFEEELTVLLGHSGVGKSTLVNRLAPSANRVVGELTRIGKGKHTSTDARAFPLSEGGWVVDTPGVRSFGLGHVTPEQVIWAFSDLAEAAEECPRGCGHLGPPADPECLLDELPDQERVTAVRELMRSVGISA
ncbi:MAG: ribosome small subunit-dependent GTPase A [Segniliparus sp.]|uniref:ribosome small subunit-dependent GTPase A n=1 Tax=Segniliparus sp. TaxID=2804064 RepID=UPI003F3F60BF